jgi:hypothetical protein
MINFFINTPVSYDCTCGYRIEMDKEYTILEFINTILTEKDLEWGWFKICNGHSTVIGPSFEYNYGSLVTPICNEIRSMRVKSVSASGGWSRMDYIIYPIL